MLERCYLHDYDLPKLSRSVAAEVRYENVTLFNDWGQPVGVGKQYFRDCASGCCWFVSDYCCPVTSYDLVTRAVAVIVTLLLITAVIVVVLCGGAVLSRRGGQRLPSWLQQRQRRQLPCLISDYPDTAAATLAGSAAEGEERHSLRRHFQQQLSQQRFLLGLVLPPPYRPLDTEAYSAFRTPHELGQEREGLAKPPAYEYQCPRPVALHLLPVTALQTPPPVYSETASPSDVSSGVTLPEPPPSYDQCASAPASSSSSSSSSSSRLQPPQADVCC